MTTAYKIVPQNRDARPYFIRRVQMGDRSAPTIQECFDRFKIACGILDDKDTQLRLSGARWKLYTTPSPPLQKEVLHLPLAEVFLEWVMAQYAYEATGESEYAEAKSAGTAEIFEFPFE